MNAATTQQEENAFKQQLEINHRKAEKARGKMKADIIESQRPNSETLILAMDLHQVLFLPTLTHSQMFYSWQLSV